MQRLRGLIWPRSLQGQLLLAVALALLLAQGISATLLYRSQSERREAALVHTAAMRLFAAVREDGLIGPPGLPAGDRGERQLKVDRDDLSPLAPGE